MFNRMRNFWLQNIHPKIERFLLYLIKGDAICVILSIIAFVFIAIWLIKNQHDLTKAIVLSTFSAVIIERCLSALVSLIKKKIFSYIEDPQKLTTDYDKLLKRYSSEKNFVWTRNKKDVAVIPVVHEAWLFDKNTEIDDHPENEYSLPEIIHGHYEELFAAHKTSKIYNSINIRVDDWGINDENNSFVMHTGRTSYYNLLVTNCTIDYKLNDGITVRELLECGPMIHPLKQSLLSNHLGFNVFVESSDGEFMLVFRNKNVSVGKCVYSTSVSASLKVKYALNKNGIFDLNGLESGITCEIEDELGIPKEMLQKGDETGALGAIQFIAAYRDMHEGGKPQLLFFAKTFLKKDKIECIFKKNNHRNRNTNENKKKNKKELEMKTDGDRLYWISRNDLSLCDVYANKLVHKGQDLPMLPSTAACFVMLKQYLNQCHDDTLASYSMSVVQSYLKGKNGISDECEDDIFIGERFVAVIDGVTTNGHFKYGDKSPGKFATDVLMKKLQDLDCNKKETKITPREIIEQLDDALQKAMINVLNYDLKIRERDRARVSIIILDKKDKVVINYGDCNCRIGNEIHLHTKKIDEELSKERAEILIELLKKGESIKYLQKEDKGRQAIMPKLLKRFQYENKPGEYGYPVLNGSGIYNDFVKVYNVYEGQKVILCSDGYPYICNSLEESEKKLDELLKKDPLLIYDYKSTKGLQPSSCSFDDRAWVELG